MSFWAIKSLFYRILFFIFLGVVLWAFPKTTHGFRVNKLVFDYPSMEQESSFIPTPEIAQQLSRPLRYLGHGGQAYVFLSEDGAFVLKLFRHPLKEHPWRSWMRSCLYHKKPRAASDKKLQKLLVSSKLSCELASDLTGVFFAHLAQTKNELPIATIIDHMGRAHKIDLNRTRFVLQKKGSPIWNDIFKGRKELLDQFLSKVRQRVARNLRNTDVKVTTNFGLIDGQVAEWDVGSFILDESLANPIQAQEEIDRFSNKMRRFLSKKAPDLLPYFDERTSS